jgi:hypothetical protein
LPRIMPGLHPPIRAVLCWDCRSNIVHDLKSDYLESTTDKRILPQRHRDH